MNHHRFVSAFRALIKKRCAIFPFLFLVCLAQSAFSQNRTNPPKRGRTVVLESVRNIIDDGKELILTAPRGLQVDEDGALYFAEGPYVYKYVNGRQALRVGKEGQGPGECRAVYSFALHAGQFYIQAVQPPKMMRFSSNGTFVKDWPIEPGKRFWQMFSNKDDLFGLIDEMFSHPERIVLEGIVDSEFSLNRISPDSTRITRIIDIPMRHSVKKRTWQREGMLDFAVYGSHVFALHSDTYRIDRIDLKTGRIDKRISRKFSPTKDEYDIIHLCFFNDRLWVFTSEGLSKGPDRLIDVYDIEGNLIDAFYLHFPNPDLNYWIASSVISRDGILAVVQEDKTEGYLSIGQYRIR